MKNKREKYYVLTLIIKVINHKDCFNTKSKFS